MKLSGIQSFDNKNNTFGTSTRVLKNTVSQLSKNNRYSLTEPNQRYIANSIKELSEKAGEEIIKFLLNTAAKLKYMTNIKLKDNPQNDWKKMLIDAAGNVFHSPDTKIAPAKKEKLYNKFLKVNSAKNLNKTEKDILKLRDKLLSSVDIKQIENETVGGIKDFEHNLDYFIISSETTLEHKKYVLKRLNHLMSNRYHINPQLKDKKSIVAAELVNDMAIFTPGHKAPNIKAVNQKQHGMCAAISIVRKKVVYEDKPNYIDSILSELDDSDKILVYDRTKLGSKEKIMLPKIPVDFNAALAKGYRIIDASATQWMDLANKSGYSGNSYNNYTPFDEENFDINADSFYNATFEDPELKDLQEYYQALVKAAYVINGYKANRIRTDVTKEEMKNEFKKNSKAVSDVVRNLSKIISNVFPDNNAKQNRRIINSLLKLEKKYSYELKSDNKYEYIANEEEKVRKNKIENYLRDTYGANINSDTIDKIYENIDSYHSLNNSLSLPKADVHGLARMRHLYEIGAGARYQLQKGLRNENTLNYMMKKERIPNREECMEKTADMLIEKLENNSPETDMILHSISDKLDMSIETAKQGILILNQVKSKIAENIKEADKIYKSIGLNNRADGLIEYIEDILLKISEDENNTLVNTFARNLKIQPSADKVIEKLETFKNDLLQNNNHYNDIFNLIGSSSQISFLNEALIKFTQKFTSENSNDAIKTLVNSNNLDVNNLAEEIGAKINELANRISTIYSSNETLTHVLRIHDEDGNLLYTPDPAEQLMKKFENNGTIPSAVALKELQTHLDKIQKNRSSDEFNSRQGKLYDKSLYKFTKKEKQTLDTIENNINPISEYIKKQLSYVQQYIKIPLEELKRIVGVDMGHWWVVQEGTSGLVAGQDIRVLEYITGRPHYTTKDLEKAIDKIKHTPYSGISSSSVFHDRAGFHAQYIADIEPVEIEVRNENGEIRKEMADVLFQDNSWGASEHENTWIDSNGLIRTDYSNNRGGTLGYITNDKYRNGNLVTRITGEMVMENEPSSVNSRQYKKLTKDNTSSFKLPQYTSIIVDGKSPEVKNIANSIYDTIFTPTSKLIDTIKKLTAKMSDEEILSRLNSIKSFQNNWETISDRMFERIRSTDTKTAIKNQEDYDKLPNTDKLKILLEKTALQKNYYLANLPADIKNVSELSVYKGVQKKRAIKNLEYSFGKNMDILKFIEEDLSVDDANIIDNYLKSNNIKIDDGEFEKIFCYFEIENDKFNGSIKDTITTIVNDIIHKAEKITDSEEILNELKDILTTLYENKLYFRASDVKNPEIAHIIKFIDRFYNPSSDEELVQIYRNLQDMTKSEFRKQIIPNLRNEDLNIKNETGYGILKRIQRYEENAEDALCNTIYADEILKHTEKSKGYSDYTYNKLHRTSKILAKYTFDSTYREMKNDLSLLVLPKRFDQYKERNINKYGAFPAYPRINYMSDKMFQSIVDAFINPIENETEQIKSINDLKEYYELANSLKKLTKGIKSADILTDEQYKELNAIFDRMSDLSYNDESQAEVYAAITEAMDIEHGAAFKNYKKYIKIITDVINDIKQKAPIYALNNEIISNKMLINKQSQMLTDTYIRTRYQNRFSQTLQNFKQSLIKNKKDAEGNPLSEIYREQLITMLKDYFILQEPEEVLERYIQSLQKKSPLNELSSSIESLLKRALDYSKLYDMQRIIMSTLKDGIETDVKSAFDKINVPLQDGNSVLMSDESIISYIIHNMLYDSDEETSLLFIDKLGLNETYVKYAASEFDYDETKKFIDEVAAKQKNYQNYTAIFNKQYEITRDNIENGGNPVRNINKLRKVLLDAQTYSIDKAHKKIFLSAVENCKRAWKENPDINPVDILNEIFYNAGRNFENTVNELFEHTNKILESQQNIIKLMNNVKLNKDSDAAKLREETNKKFTELVEYNNKVMDNLHTEE